ncbi:hypothetical protein ACFPN4_12470 [Ureibacillus thermophilus]|uniref:Group-specific protein n=1 Tax=Ureibacillus thermophilus TaxID=367743 RepID=A0A4P6URC3_9BACL|nr:hypothetical protein [Ureibacillus thermophilus]QBK24486.1 hypothetical protein DKZ56_00275 [Ureibacillus thermophilus]
MQSKEMRLARIQRLAHEIMYEIHSMEEETEHKEFRVVIDNLSRAIGELADPYGCYSLDYIEDKLEKSHSIMKMPKLSTHGR